MAVADLAVADGIATITLHRGKVHALNPEMVATLSALVRQAGSDEAARALVLTGSGRFFSFGWDVPELLPMAPDELTAFVTTFADLYRAIFAFPKPVVAAINGHAVAGGCMLALACDSRIMSGDQGTIGLNEITFGAPLPLGSLEMLRYWVGSATATEVVVSGALYGATDAQRLGLVDRIVPSADLPAAARAHAEMLGQKNQGAYREIKASLRAGALDAMSRHEHASIERFVRVWYSPETRAALEHITIR